MSFFNLEGVSKAAVDEAADKLGPIIEKLQTGLTQAMSFAIQDGIDRVKSGKITITVAFDFPPPKAKVNGNN